MEPEQINSFDDPALRASVKRLWGDEKAPETLRDRVLKLTGATEATTPPALRLNEEIARPTPWIHRINWTWATGLAAAAVLVLALAGVFVARLWGPDSTGINPTVLAGLVKTHDTCTACRDHHEMVASNDDDFARVGHSIRQQMESPVLSANLVDDGWTFEGASCCPSCGQTVAHLSFRRDGQTVSVFSMAAPADAEDGSVYVGRIDEHPVAARVKNHGLFCIVGQCPGNKLQESELDQLLLAHESQIIEMATAPVVGVSAHD